MLFDRFWADIQLMRDLHLEATLNDHVDGSRLRFQSEPFEGLVSDLGDHVAYSIRPPVPTGGLFPSVAQQQGGAGSQ